MAKSAVTAFIVDLADPARYFPGLSIVEGEEIYWQADDNPEERGRYWTGIDAEGVPWVSDGREVIAAFAARAFRFYRCGIRQRRVGLVNKYLKGRVPHPRDTTVINFGANVGEVALTLAEDGARVLAIEPDPNVLPLLAANARGKAIEVAPVAAWFTDGAVRLYLKSETADSSIFNASDEMAMVPCRRIDTLVEERGIDRVHLLIGDAEGAEPEVLQGAMQTLKITSYVSVCASKERCGETTVDACESLLESAGFDIIFREESGFCTLIGKNREALPRAA